MAVVVVVHRASGLPSTDFTSAIDPYVVVTVGDQVALTNVQRSAGPSPDFNAHKFVFEWYYGVHEVRFVLKDQDSFSSDDHLCSAVFPLQRAVDTKASGEGEVELLLERGKQKKPAGSLWVDVMLSVPKEVYGGFLS